MLLASDKLSEAGEPLGHFEDYESILCVIVFQKMNSLFNSGMYIRWNVVAKKDLIGP